MVVGDTFSNGQRLLRIEKNESPKEKNLPNSKRIVEFTQKKTLKRISILVQFSPEQKNMKQFLKKGQERNKPFKNNRKESNEKKKKIQE